ncbi:MAG: 50S ribosomal protein L13 [Nanoarchaeota archaeon]|nr:50S ribosomal protein L13 [Nanoarchaeota archaeon]
MKSKETAKSEELVINGENEVLGRVASFAAKQALQGKSVVVVNCEHILVSGNRANIIDRYLVTRRRNAVKFPSVPEKIVKRTIRGMIKYKSGRGAAAFKKLRCYNSAPASYKDANAVKLGNKNIDMMDLKELGRMLKAGRID